MKKPFPIAAMTLALAFAMTACGGLSNATALGVPKSVSPLAHYEAAETDPTMRNAAKAFAATFSAEALKGQTGNAAVSPVSVYFALGLAAQCAAGETREELLTALNVGYDVLNADASDFYRSVIAEHAGEKGIEARVDVGNSIWVQEGFPVKQDCIDVLADNYLCYSYAADFMDKNSAANAAVRDFVKRQTHGLIDQDFQLSVATVFALVNTLYLKEIWGNSGGLPFTEEKYDFTQGDGTERPINLLCAAYQMGQTYEAETFTHFYATTLHGYRLKFLLPKEGHTAEEVFTAENFALVNGMEDYRAFDDAAQKRYYTRCLFPEFESEYDADVKDILQKMGVKKLFSEGECDFSTLTDGDAFCAKLQHVTKLKVEREGIEGAAVTIATEEATSEPPGPDYEPVYADFVLDRAFGFALTDRFGTVLFSGIVNMV